MGKVKELWQDERDAEIEARIMQFIMAGYSQEEAEDVAEWEMIEKRREE